MDQAAVDSLLKRKLYLQRFVKHVFDDVTKASAKLDRVLVADIRDFFDNASDSALLAFSRQRGGKSDAARAIQRMRDIVRQQHDQTLGILKNHTTDLIDSEVQYISKVMDIDSGKAGGVSSLPVAGATLAAAIALNYQKYHSRLVADVTQIAVTDPGKIGALILGSKSQNRKDGLLSWRNRKLTWPLVDVIVNGTAANADDYVYKQAKVKMVDHLSTLDFRVCPSCAAAEDSGPYERGRQPAIPIHPNCRCVNIPVVDSSIRPYVRDHRSVKDIPKNERSGKIGTTTDDISDFWGRWTDAERLAYLGPGRFDLWKQGRITRIQDLVDPITLSPLRIDQLIQATP